MPHTPGHEDPKNPKVKAESRHAQRILRESDISMPASIPTGVPKKIEDLPDWDIGSDADLVTELIARGAAKVAGRDAYDMVKGVIEYGFVEQDEAGKAAIKAWSFSGASYSDMPPGALRYELPAAALPGIGDIQALRDVWKDLKNKEASGWTMVDLVSVVPGAIGAGGFLVGMMRHSDEFAGMGKLWRAVEDIRAVDPDILPDELIEMVKKQGFTDDEARRVVGLGKEKASDFIGAHGDETVIGSRADEALGAEFETMQRPERRSGARPAQQDYRDAYDGAGQDGLDLLNRQRGTDMTLAKLEDIEAGMVRRTGDVSYEDVAVHPRYKEARAARAAGVTDLDRQIAKRHNDAYDAATPEQRMAGDVGSSTGPDGKDPTKRYMVAPDKATETQVDVVDNHITPEQVAIYRVEHPGEKFTGTWQAKPDGPVTFDMSDEYDAAEAAHEIARKGKQEGIFDRKEGKFVLTEAAPESALPTLLTPLAGGAAAGVARQGGLLSPPEENGPPSLFRGVFGGGT